MKTYLLTMSVLFIGILAGCCKEKDCKENTSITPFIEKYGDFWCTGNDEYTYILRTKAEIDALTNCTFSPTPAFPVDETDMVYIAVGRLSYHYKDTFETRLLRNDCDKKIVYEVNMIQTDTAFNCCPYGIGAVSTMFCSVDSVPADYEVEVKYKYVPIQ